MNQVPKVVWFILGLLLLLQITTLVIAVNKPAGKSYPSQAQTIRGAQGQIGLTGPQGQPGLSIQGNPGEPGPVGIQGPAVTSDQISSSIATYLQANPPMQGEVGPQGEPGTDGKSVELRYANNEIEWRFSGDITWTPLVQACTLTNSCVSQ